MPSWKPGPAPSPPTDEIIDEIVVIRKTGRATARTSDTPLVTLNPSATSYTDTMAVEGRRYTYTLYTVSEEGTYSDPTTVTFRKEADTPNLTNEAKEEVEEERQAGGVAVPREEPVEI